jgi:hypothetical protein
VEEIFNTLELLLQHLQHAVEGGQHSAAGQAALLVALLLQQFSSPLQLEMLGLTWGGALLACLQRWVAAAPAAALDLGLALSLRAGGTDALNTACSAAGRVPPCVEQPPLPQQACLWDVSSCVALTTGAHQRPVVAQVVPLLLLWSMVRWKVRDMSQEGSPLVAARARPTLMAGEGGGGGLGAVST